MYHTALYANKTSQAINLLSVIFIPPAKPHDSRDDDISPVATVEAAEAVEAAQAVEDAVWELSLPHFPLGKSPTQALPLQEITLTKSSCCCPRLPLGLRPGSCLTNERLAAYKDCCCNPDCLFMRSS